MRIATDDESKRRFTPARSDDLAAVQTGSGKTDLTDGRQWYLECLLASRTAFQVTLALVVFVIAARRCGAGSARQLGKHRTRKTRLCNFSAAERNEFSNMQLI